MVDLIERKEYIDKLFSYKDKDLIKVVTGLRRCGKSTLLEMFRSRLVSLGTKEMQTQLYNFELPENYLNKSWDSIYFDIKSKLQPNLRNYIFLDEVQISPTLKNWLMVYLLQKMSMSTLPGPMLIYCPVNWQLFKWKIH